MRIPLLLAVFVFCAPVAHSQIAEVYGTFSIDPLRNVELLPYTSQQYSSFTPVGVNFGGTLNFINFARITAGLDASETIASGANFWLAGFRIMVKPPVIRIKPSFKLSVGEAHLRTPQTVNPSIPNPVVDSYYIYNAALGIDYRLTHFVDARIEIGDGRTLGAGAANPMNLLTVNMGVVAHF